jgi:uncharacterized membrane protein YcaP (DUF421 family)
VSDSVTGGLIGALTLLAVNYLVVRFLFRHRRLDQLLAGKPTTLIEHGQLKQRALASELLNESELLSIAHRHGFTHLRDIERCVLEPGGTFFMQGKTLPNQEKQQAEVLAELAEIKAQIAELRCREAASK